MLFRSTVAVSDRPPQAAALSQVWAAGSAPIWAKSLAMLSGMKGVSRMPQMRVVSSRLYITWARRAPLASISLARAQAVSYTHLMEATVDCKHGILTGVDVYPANEKESLLVLRHLERQINLGVPMKRLALDRGYETGAVHRGLELLGITGYIPAIQFSNPPEKYGFSYDPQLDAFICPEGVSLTYHRLNCSKSTGKYLRCYQVEGNACMRCPKL